jgi:hypothetical protein
MGCGMAGTTPQENLVALSRWIDEGNAHRDPEAQLCLDLLDARLDRVVARARQVR